MKYDYRIRTLSPVHIGSGHTIDTSEVASGDPTYRIDMESLFSDPEIDIGKMLVRLRQNSFDVTRLSEEKRERHARYKLSVDNNPLILKNLQSRGELLEFIMTAGHVYIPGSSVKGIIRTAILMFLVATSGEIREVFLDSLSSSRGRREWFSNRAVGKVLGDSPNTDLLRTVKVSDSEAWAPEVMDLQAVKTYSSGQFKDFVTLPECLPVGSALGGQISVDFDLLNSSRVKSELGWVDIQIRSLEHLGDILARYGQHLIEGELKYWRQETAKSRWLDMTEVLDFYEQLLEEVIAGKVILPLGWGTGWRTKTVGELVEEADPSLFADIRKRNRLGRKGMQFPKSRKVAVNENGQPSKPLGWVCLDLSST